MNGIAMGKTSIKAWNDVQLILGDRTTKMTDWVLTSKDSSTYRVVTKTILQNWGQPVHRIRPSSFPFHHRQLLLTFWGTPRCHQIRFIMLDHQTLVFPLAEWVGRLECRRGVRDCEVASSSSRISEVRLLRVEVMPTHWQRFECAQIAEAHGETPCLPDHGQRVFEAFVVLSQPGSAMISNKGRLSSSE